MRAGEGRVSSAAMAPAVRTRVGCGASLLLFAALLGGSAAPGCAPSSLRGQSIANPLYSPDGIAALGSSGQTIYAVTYDRTLRSWDLRTRTLRTLDRGAIGIARDGAIALRMSGTLVQAWETRSGKPIAAHVFAHGIRKVLGVSPVGAQVVTKLPKVQWLPAAAAAPPPDTESVSWDFASGKVDTTGRFGCNELWLSADGARTVCDGAWRDRPAGVVKYPPTFAPEWAPPGPAPEPPPRASGSPDIPDTGYDLLSSWLSADGLAVYVSYARTTGGTEWRLERWIPDVAGKTDGRVERLAVSHEPIVDKVVAASRDGRTILTSPGQRPPVLRHAPGYEGIPLLAPPVTAAAFSEDETLIVTGHGDGRLRLWEAKHGRFVAISAD
jgi:WD40 repeat protein